MKSPEERRTPHVERVSLAALVDICSQTGDGSPFQAESCNVSGRGMHVRTSFLPEIGDELVCRLNLDEEEILVEGRVAWRSEGEDSGEFGIQFTALDADSAHLLQKMGEPKKLASSFQVMRSPRAPEVDEEFEEEEDSRVLVAGSRVRLHIEGLGAPMKACVHEGSQRKVRVGSSLEFLKVGRNLQLEDLNGGISRGAQVDSVNVVINPATSIPELVVQLRYEGVTPTPPPAELEDRTGPSFDDEVFGASSARQPKSTMQRSASRPEQTARKLGAARETHADVDGDELDDDQAAVWEPAAEALRERLGGAMHSASQAAQKAGGLLGSLADAAKASVLARTGRFEEKKAPLRKTSHRGTYDSKMASPEAARRVQTSRRESRDAPSHLRSGIHELGLAGKSTRPARSIDSKAAVPAPARRKLGLPVVFGAAFLFLSGSAVILRGMGGDEATEAAALPPAPLAEGQAKPAAAPAAPTAAVPAKPAAEASVVAEVPLFGPQAMAVKLAEPTPSREDTEASEMRAAAASVEDQSWEEPAVETEVLESKPWGNGKLYLPTVHRIRLDGAAPSLSGAVNQNGFTIVVPGRKAMESGKAIQKRDKRIMAVETNNNAGGATVKFEFRGPVPPYRVRLRQDFVEFLISAPEETVARL